MSRTPYPKTSAPAPKPLKQLTVSEPKVKIPGPQSPAPLIEGTHLMRPIDRAPPGDVARSASKAQSKTDLTRQKSKRNFFEDAFLDNPPSLARERVHGDAIVTAEVKTNVIVRDEFTFISELAYHLSTRYQRPVSSIVVTLRHGACMFWGGSFDPAYVMSVSALPSQLQPTTNRRNAALIQRHMEDTLGVRPGRGLLRFVPVPEECLVCDGRTVAGEVEELERGGDVVGGSPAAVVEANGVPNKVEKIASGRKEKKMLSVNVKVKSIAALRPLSTAARLPTPELTPPGSGDEDLPPMPGAYPQMAESEASGAHSPQRKAQRKKSFVATIFSRSSSKSSYDPSLPAIADEA
ncbi:Tautomerase/MIF superfamily [Chaetomium fimeti]|uniref:L-dopachrome isomerase n=1 Tax=Chaetomium fimeti TaxID=1854472 RepID=A0AAE0LS69_9PEZI|nr:Tautomerase/MIF superfamily [Chaetomium fimeti]